MNVDSVDIIVWRSFLLRRDGIWTCLYVEGYYRPSDRSLNKKDQYYERQRNGLLYSEESFENKGSDLTIVT